MSDTEIEQLQAADERGELSAYDRGRLRALTRAPVRAGRPPADPDPEFDRTSYERGVARAQRR